MTQLHTTRSAANKEVFLEEVVDDVRKRQNHPGVDMGCTLLPASISTFSWLGRCHAA